MSRVLVAWLPCFRLERCGWRAEDPVILVADQGNALRIQDLTPTAARFGLSRGMSVSEARAVEPSIRVEQLEDTEEERLDLECLAQLFQRLSPHLRALPPSAIAVQIDRDERRAVRQALDLLDELEHRARIVVADEAQGALALARWGDGHRIVPPGTMAQALAGLPVRSLDPNPRVAERMQAMGIQRLGELAVIPAASIAARFGREGLRLHRIARGEHRLETMPVLHGPHHLAFRRQLPEPVEQLDAVLFVLNELVGRLQAALRERETAVVRLQLRLDLEDAPPFLLTVRLGQPRRLSGEIMVVLRQRLKGLRLAGPMTEIELRVLDQVRFVGRQQDLLDRRQKEPAEDLLARLTDALGEGALYRPELQERHRPELEWTAGVFDLRARRDAPIPRRHRPHLLLRELLPIRVEISPRGEPQALQVEGRWVTVHTGRGPERLCGEWWETRSSKRRSTLSEPFDRDYWRCTLTDGRCAWVFMRRQDHDWWLHGWFD